MSFESEGTWIGAVAWIEKILVERREHSGSMPKEYLEELEEWIRG
jgi:hypothetical protein